jgi:hypothetical protein
VNWIVIDVAPTSVATGVVGYLHGAFKPSVRLCHIQSQDEVTETGLSGSALYSGVEVGYRKDIVRWWNMDTLVSGLTQRIEALDAGRLRVSTLQDALSYFQSASLQKEAVFISYAGPDEQRARDLREAFRRRFQQVFDYRDGNSIRPGEPWIKEIFERLNLSAIGVPLLSPSYVESGNCMHELREMVARFDNKQMQIFPVKLDQSDRFAIPP